MKKELDYHAKLVIEGLPNMKRPTVKRIIIWLDRISNQILEAILEEPQS